MAKKKAKKKVAQRIVEKIEGPAFKYVGKADSMDLYGLTFPKGEAVAIPDNKIDIEGRLSRNTLFERC